MVFATTAFSAHKFYVAIHQINFNKEKKTLEITNRIFIDDLNEALGKKFQRTFHLGDPEESSEDVALMKQYISENFIVYVNGIKQPTRLVSKEVENNVIICYFKCQGIASISSLEVESKILFEYVTEQQNIIQTKVNGKKQSLLLTIDNPIGKINY